MRERVDEIVEEVVRRLKLYMSEKRVLLLLRDDSDFAKVKQLTGLLEDAGYTLVVCSFLSKDIKVLEDSAFSGREYIQAGIFREVHYEDFQRRYHGVVISDLRVEECSDFRDLRFRETLGKIVFHTLKENKPVYACSKDMTGVKNAYLKNGTDAMKEELRKMKIHLLTEEWRKGAEEEIPKEEKGISVRRDSEGLYREEAENFLPHRFITLSDVNTVGSQKEILIQDEARLTMEASDYVRRHGIRIRKRKKSE